MDFLRTMVKAKKFILSRHFVGFPQPGDLQLIEEELRPLKDGEFLAQALYLSVDPYMRKYANTIPLQSTMVGTQVAKIVDSKNDKFPVGQFVAAPFGWRTFTISNGEPAARRVPVLLLPDMGDLPLSLAIGVLGMPGNSAYFGFLEILHPQAGETIAISGAAGAVGSHVGQIAKIKGLKVIGIAGSDEKGRFLTKDLGFDHFINYKTEDISQTLQEIAPEGVDLYFDNVGGEVSDAVLTNMKDFGRVSACGSISGYNDAKPQGPLIQPTMVAKQLKMQGFQNVGWRHRWSESFGQNLEWIKEGKLKYKETVTEGFENMFNAFTEMLQGGNTGKAIVKV
uniref:Prostaglandin reductase 1 n=1 Tax=Dendroctonus ponderosae TaxID=77166 RepID=A0AAR5PIF0_DENPD